MASIKISFIKPRALKERLWKGLTTFVAVTTVFNLSLGWVWLTPVAWAQDVPDITSAPTVDNWSAADAHWTAYTYEGKVVTDYEDNVCGINDESHGSANVTPQEVDLASYAGHAIPCDNPGPAATLHTATDDDYFYFRLRLRADPEKQSGSVWWDYHWDVLLDIDDTLECPDGAASCADNEKLNYSEYVIDLFGTGDYLKNLHKGLAVVDALGVLGVYKNNEGSFEYDPDEAASIVWQAEANRYAQDSGEEYTRVVETGDGQYWLDLAIPKEAVESQFTSYHDVFASTSASNINPLQKDWMGAEGFFTNIVKTKSVQNLTNPGYTTTDLPAKPGDTLRYTLTAVNEGNIYSPGFVMWDDVSDIVQYTTDPIASNNGDYDTIDQEVYWPQVSLQPGVVKTETFDVTIKPSSEWPTGDNFTLDNVYGEAATDVPLCYLTIEKSVDKSAAEVDDTLTYTLNYANIGAADCTGTGVRIDDQIPANTTYIIGSNTEEIISGDTDLQGISFGYSETKFDSANPTGYDGSLLSWNANIVSPGESGRVTFQVTVNQLPACQTTNIDNFGKIYADQFMTGIASNTVRTAVETACLGDLTVIKDVNNDNGGVATAGDFTMHIKQGGVDAVTPFAGSATGTTFSLLAGDYQVSESDLPSGYAQTSIVCDGQATDTITVVAGAAKTCTITNDDMPGTLIVKKVLPNDNGGTATPDQFSFSINGQAPIAFEADGQNESIVGAGVYSVVETNPMSGYAVSYDNCTDVVVPNGGTATCTITNDDQAGTLIVKKQLYTYYGGNEEITDFSFTVNGGASIAFEADGRNDLPVPAGTYTVVEDAAAGYRTTYEYTDNDGTRHVGDCADMTVPNGGIATCFITNVDTAPSITLIKNVINDNGGTAGPQDFGLTIDGTAVYSGQQLPVNSNTPIAINEAGLFGYEFVSITGAGCPTNLGEAFTMDEGENITCTITNDDIQPLITVIKHVVNDNGGDAVASDFSISISGSEIGYSVPGNESGETRPINAGAYDVTEMVQPGYAESYSADCTGTIAVGEHKYCTITNDDIAPTVTLIKKVINDNGGTTGVNDFGLTIGGTVVNSGDTLNVDANTPVALNEAGLFGYDFVSITGDDKCPRALSGTVTLDEGEHITCTITNDDIQPKLTVYKYVDTDNGGTAVPSDFTLNVSGEDPSPATFPGSDLGTLVTLNAGDYLVTEDYYEGYTPSFSPDCVGRIAVGQEKVCYVTNTDDAPRLIVTKHVINDDGGTYEADDFTMHVAATDATPADFPGDESGTEVSLKIGGYNVTETGPDGYYSYSDGCSGTIALGETKYCTITNYDIAPQLTVIKQVVNDNGGSAVAGEFTMLVTATDPSDNSFPGDTNGTTITLDAGIYTVDESGPSGYIASYVNCIGSIAIGESKTCTITNNDQAPSLTLIKKVVNDNNGAAEADNWILTATGPTTISGTSGVTSGTDFEAGTYALSESGPSGYTASNWSCVGGTLVGDQVTLAVGQSATCEITNDDIQPTLTVTKVVNNDNGGNATVADFPLFVDGTSVTSGVATGFNAGSYLVSETQLNGYELLSITGDCDANGNVTLGIGDQKSCVITNDDMAPSITLIKKVITDNGGTAGVNDFGLTIGGTAVNSGDTLNVDANTPVALNEAGLFGYDFVSITGDDKCPQLRGGTVTLDEGEDITCTITNDDVAPTLTVIKHVDLQHGGTATADQFTMRVFNNDILNSTFAGAEAPGVTVAIDQGTYSVQEQAQVDGYVMTGYDNCSNTINVGENQTCTITNTDLPGTLIVKKVLTTDNGGTAAVTNFSFKVNGGTDAAFEADGQNDLTVDAGTYTVTENAAPGYATSYDNCADVVVPNGGTATCTITNNDIAPSLTLVKEVVNRLDAPADATLWTLTATGPTGITGSTPVTSGADFSAGTYLLSESGGPVGYSASNWVCTGDGAQNGDEITLALDEHATCTITNTRDTGEIYVHKQIDTDGDGTYDVTDDSVATDTYGFYWSLDRGLANRAMGTSAEVTTVDTHTVDENDVPNYHFTDYFIGEGSCGDRFEDAQLFVAQPARPVDFTVNKDGATHITFCNARDTGTITVIKNVINDDGGQKVASDFTMTIGGVSMVNDTASFPGDELGTTRDVLTGDYNITETELIGYAATYSADCTGPIGWGESKTCTITNDDIPSEIDVVKNGPASVTAGEQIDYTIDWAIFEPGFAKDAVLTDTLPSNTTFVAADCGTTAGTCVIDSSVPGFVTWTLGDRVAPDSGTVNLTVRTISPEQDGTIVHNVVVFNTSKLSAEDEHDTIIESAPILTVVKTNSVAGFTNPGKTVTYTVVVSNDDVATDTADDVVLSDILPSGFTYVDGGGASKSWNLGDLAPGESSDPITYEVKISASQAAGTYTNTASALATNHGKVSDTSDVEVRVPQTLGDEPEIDLSIVKSVDPAMTNPGKIVTYTLTVNNLGDEDATNVVVTDTLPTGFTFVEGGRSVKIFDLGTLEGNHTRVINYEVRVGTDVTAGFYKNTAVLEADGTDPLVAQAELEIRVPRVLGLATTGVSFRDYLIFAFGLTAFSFSFWMFRRRALDGIDA